MCLCVIMCRTWEGRSGTDSRHHGLSIRQWGVSFDTSGTLEPSSYVMRGKGFMMYKVVSGDDNKGWKVKSDQQA